jgi:hypothetical protein
MTLRLVIFAALACGAVGACTPKKVESPVDAPTVAEAPAEEVTVAAPVDETEPAAIDTEADACKASEHRSLIGTNAAAVSLPADLVHRIYKDGDPVTADYNAARLNIVTDADGVITEVKCG